MKVIKKNFLLHGNRTDLADPIELDEIVITGTADGFKRLGLFFLRCAAEIDIEKKWDHSHFLYSGLSRKRAEIDVDIICIKDTNSECK